MIERCRKWVAPSEGAVNFCLMPEMIRVSRRSAPAPTSGSGWYTPFAFQKAGSARCYSPASIDASSGKGIDTTK